MISFDLDGVRFNFRVGGVCLDEGHVLLNRNAGDDWWYLPGGRCEPMEASARTLEREIEEELQAGIEVGELLWVAENFFTLHGQEWHELGLYFRFRFPAESPFLAKGTPFHRVETDRGLELIYAWVPLDDVAGIRLLPSFLASRLLRLPSRPEHIVHRDPPAHHAG